MKKYTFFFVFIFLIAHSALAGTTNLITRNRVIEEHVYVQKHDRLVIDSRSGNITVRTWDRHEAYVSITIQARGYNDVEVRELLKKVSIQKQIHENGSGEIAFSSDLSHVNEDNGVLPPTEDDNGQSLTVNYEIWIPACLSLDITQHFGNVYFCNDFTGMLQLKLDIGCLKAKGLYGAAKTISIDRVFGKKSYINYLDNAYLNGVQGLTIKRAGNIRVNTSRSLNILSASTINISGSNSNLNIGTVGNIYGQLDRTSSYVDIQNISNNAHLSIADCDRVNFHSFGAHVGRIDINTQNSFLYFDRINNVKVAITADEKTEMQQAPYFLHREYDGRHDQTYQGIIGNGNGTLNIDATHSTISF